MPDPSVQHHTTDGGSGNHQCGHAPIFRNLHDVSGDPVEMLLHSDCGQPYYVSSSLLAMTLCCLFAGITNVDSCMQCRGEEVVTHRVRLLAERPELCAERGGFQP